MIKYYLIHGIDKSRAQRMSEEFIKANIPENDVTWIISHNKDQITDEFAKSLLIQTESVSCGRYVHAGCPYLRKGQISCAYKHYLALKDIVEKGYQYSIIMEDNIQFKGNVVNAVTRYLNELNSNYPEWDILFDGEIPYRDGELREDRIVYPKSNEMTEFGHGGTRYARFYLLTKECAKKLYENYIPFNNAPDWWMNDLFRKLNIKALWSEPSISEGAPHESTAN